MPEDNRTICRRLIEEAVNKGNLAEIDKYVATSYVYHGPDGLEIRGPEGFKQLVSMYRGAFPDLHMTIEDLIAEGDKVVTRWKARGTHKGNLMGIPPTNKISTVAGIIVTRFAGGKVVEDWESFDEVAMFRQLGVHAIPAPAHV
jgi:steroid delta-isomerase-like uncharacterized protein